MPQSATKIATECHLLFSDAQRHKWWRTKGTEIESATKIRYREYLGTEIKIEIRYGIVDTQ